HKLLDSRLPGAPHQVVQERFIGINGVNQSAELLRQRQRLTTRTATGIDNDTEPRFGKKAQGVQGMGVVPRPELFRTAEEQADWIVGAHVVLDRLLPNCRKWVPVKNTPSGLFHPSSLP